MRKEELIQLAENRGFPRYKTIKYGYYLYLCILQQMLRDSIHYNINVYAEKLENDKFGATSQELDRPVPVEGYTDWEEKDYFDTYEEALEDGIITTLLNY